MSILDNEGHDPLGFGNTPPMNEVAAAEIAELRAALIQIRGFAFVMNERNWRDLRLHIERQTDAVNQQTELHEQGR